MSTAAARHAQQLAGELAQLQERVQAVEARPDLTAPVAALHTRVSHLEEHPGEDQLAPLTSYLNGAGEVVTEGGGGGGGGEELKATALPAAGKKLEAGHDYIGEPGVGEERELAAPANGARLEVTILGAHNLVVKGAIEGKPSIEVGANAPAENNSVVLVGWEGQWIQK